MKLPTKPPGHATVVAYLALFVALGGTGYAAATIGSADVIDDSLLSRDIKNGEVTWYDLGPDSVSTYKIAPGAVFNSDIHDGVVNSRKVSDNSLTAADIGANAVGASELAPAEAWRPIRPPSETPEPNEAYFLTSPYDTYVSFANLGSGSYNTAAYFRDHSGVVHLRGGVGCGAGDLILSSCHSSVLSLPPGYRPAAVEVMPGAWTSGAAFDGDEFSQWEGFARVLIQPDGTLSAAFPYNCCAFDVSHLSLDGMTFRAAGFE